MDQGQVNSFLVQFFAQAFEKVLNDSGAIAVEVWLRSYALEHPLFYGPAIARLIFDPLTGCPWTIFDLREKSGRQMTCPDF